MTLFNVGPAMLLMSSLFATVATPLLAQRAAVNLGSAAGYVILSKTGITDVPSSIITGNIGASPITGAAVQVSCAEVNGTISAVDAAGPAPCSLVDPSGLSTAIADAATAYTDAAGRTTPDFTELGAGNISGKTLLPGLYKWSTDVSIDNTGVTLSGDPTAVWIFQIAGDLTLADAGRVRLLRGARASNIFWQVGGPAGATLGTNSVLYGTLLSAKQVVMNTGATLIGRALAMTQVTLQSSTVTNPDLQCSYALTPSSPFADATAQTLTIQISTNSANCSWDATASGFASVSGPSSGTGSGSVSYGVSQNSTGTVRTAALTIAGQDLQLTQRTTAQTFSDVLPSDSDFDAANLMRQRLITSGCSTQPTLRYCPDDSITRGQAAVFIVRAIMGGGSNADKFQFTAIPWFTDVPANHPFFKWIQKMKDLGITSGCGAASYCPDAAITREQMAAFVIKARYGATMVFDFPPAPFFADVPAGSTYFKWIQKLKQIGITSGCTATTYCPGANVTRGQMAIFVMRGAFNLLLPPATPVIVNVAPPSGVVGSTVTVSLTGQNTNFLQGTTTVTAGPDISAVGINVADPTHLTSQFSIPPNAAAAPVSVVVRTGPQEAAGPNSFTVSSGQTAGAVTIDSFSFMPSTIAVASGAQVTWTNVQTGILHNITSDDSSFPSQNVPSGASVSQTFSAAGSYAYHCSIHSFMRGTVTVQ